MEPPIGCIPVGVSLCDFCPTILFAQSDGVHRPLSGLQEFNPGPPFSHHGIDHPSQKPAADPALGAVVAVRRMRDAPAEPAAPRPPSSRLPDVRPCHAAQRGWTAIAVERPAEASALQSGARREAVHGVRCDLDDRGRGTASRAPAQPQVDLQRWRSKSRIPGAQGKGRPGCPKRPDRVIEGRGGQISSPSAPLTDPLTS